jgi:hypothetical protein
MKTPSTKEIEINVSEELELVLFWGGKYVPIQLTPKVAKELAERLLVVVKVKAAANN